MRIYKVDIQDGYTGYFIGANDVIKFSSKGHRFEVVSGAFLDEIKRYFSNIPSSPISYDSVKVSSINIVTPTIGICDALANQYANVQNDCWSADYSGYIVGFKAACEALNYELRDNALTWSDHAGITPEQWKHKAAETDEAWAKLVKERNGFLRPEPKIGGRFTPPGLYSGGSHKNKSEE